MARPRTRALAALFALLVPMAALTLTPSGASAAVDPAWYRFCMRAHLANQGWEAWQCRESFNFDLIKVGTTGQNRAIEAVEVTAAGFDVCLRGHVRNVGWQSARCTKSRLSSASVTAGTTGRGLPLEALTISLQSDALIPGPTGRRITAVGHVQNIGWMGTNPWPALSTSVTVGTTGRALNLESVMLQLS